MPFELCDDGSDSGIVSLKNQVKWGPLGPLPEGWEKAIDNDDHLWRPYYRDSNTGLNYWTRPLCSICPGAKESTWDQTTYVAAMAYNL
jgi:hypothetical protein